MALVQDNTSASAATTDPESTEGDFALDTVEKGTKDRETASTNAATDGEGEEEKTNTQSSSDKNSSSSKAPRKLSTFSRTYDFNGDGELDEAERAMRNMDSSGRGFISNEKVYLMMKENMEMHRKLFKTKGVVFALVGLVVLLAVSNLGTSFAAASLAKETTANENEQLIHISTKEALSTQTTDETIDVHLATIDDGDVNNNSSGRRRKLCSTVNGSTVCQASENSFLSLDENDCLKFVKKCRRGNNVSLLRRWPNGDETIFALCPAIGTFAKNEEASSLRRRDDGVEFSLEKGLGDGEGYCRISGNAVSQNEGEICLATGDCNSSNGLVCVTVTERVQACQRRCAMRRWAPRMVEECKVGCDHATCEAEETTGEG